MGAAGLRADGVPDRIASTEYTSGPGAGSFTRQWRKRFVLYADLRLHKPDIIRPIDARVPDCYLSWITREFARKRRKSRKLTLLRMRSPFCISTTMVKESGKL